MKLVTLLLSFVTFFIYAQTDCKHGVSTDPESPKNVNSLPILANGNYNQQFINSFDWFPIGAPGTPEEGLYLGYSLTNMSFAGTPLPIMSSIMSNQGTLPYYDYIYNGPLPITENGWELLLVNVGRFSDDATPIPLATADLHSFPYIVIYNKFLGKIRVFCKFGLDQTVYEATDAVEISFRFANLGQYSGAMRLYAGTDRSLDLQTEVTVMTSVTKAQNFGNKWYSTDFQIAYDPCTCFYPSKIQLQFSQIKEARLTAHSRTIELEDQSLIDNSNLTVNPSDWLTGFDYTGNAVGGGGIAIAKSLNLMTTRYIADLEKYKTELALTQEANKEVKKRIAVVKLFEKVVLQGGSSLIVDLVNLPFWNDIDNFAKELVGSTVVDSAALVKTGKKYLAAGVNGLKTMITGELKPLPLKPEVPVATFSETSYSGEISIRSDYAGPTFFTPGTYGSSGTGSPPITSVYSYPIYNEVLGTFALLKKPKINITKYTLDEEDEIFQKTIRYNSGLTELNLQRYQSWSKSYNISFSEKLEYAFNDILNIKDYQISSSFVIKAKRIQLQTQNSSTRIAAYHDHEKFVNTKLTNEDIENYSPIYSSDQGYRHLFNNPDLNVNNWANNPTILVNNTEFDIETPFIPIDAMMPFDASFAVKNEVVSFKPNYFYEYDMDNLDFNINNNGQYFFDLNNPLITKPLIHNSNNSGFEYEFEIELKLLIDIEFNDVDEYGRPHRATEIHTFKIDPSWITNVSNSFAIWDQIQPINISKYYENLVLGNTLFDGSQVNGCTLSNNKYTCRAWNDIKIDGDIITSNGFTAEIIAGNEIEVTPESVVSQETILYIKPLLDYSNPMPKATLSQVKSFCGANTGNLGEYLANQGTKRVTDTSFVVNSNNLEDIKRSFSVYLFPNPTSQNTTLNVIGDNIENLSINVYNVTGIKQQVIISGENGNYNINVSNLAKGLYIVNVSTYGESQSKQLVIQ